MPVAAAHRGYEIEAGRARVAGLDAVDALDVAEQLVVIADGMTAINKNVGREVPVVAREAILYGAAKRRLIARSGDLGTIGTPRRVPVHRTRHAKRARL